MGLFDKNKKKSEAVTAAPASTFATRMTEKKANASAGDWAKTSSALLSEIERNDGTWQSADAYHDLNTRLNTLLASAGKWRAAYASDQKATAQINDVVSALTRAQEYENEQRKYWSQWDSAEAYDGYLKAQEAEAARWRELSGNYDAVRDAQTAQEGLTAFDTVLRERAAAEQAKEEKP